MQRNEHRKNPRGLADLLLPYALIDDGILLQQDGSCSTGVVVSRAGHDVGVGLRDGFVERPAEPVLAARSGWMVQCDAIRTRAPGYPEQGAFADPVTPRHRRRAPPAVHG